MPTSSVATAVAHPNIALVKYWGKRHDGHNLPAVPSLSLTLDGFLTTTTVRWGVSADSFVLNGVARKDPKVFATLDRIDSRRPCVEVESHNDFPTGAGLASSASGFAALAVAAVAASGQSLSLDAIGAIARQGSGSACRSLFGGFVEWGMGTGSADSVAKPVPSPLQVRMVVAVVSDAEKAVGSTEGMRRSRETSPYWAAWTAMGPGLVSQARQAVVDGDLEALGVLMERSTFAMHATMHTATPPLLYWQPATVALLHEVTALRQQGVGAWATMDAGPQVKVLCAPEDAPAVQSALSRHARAVHVHGAGPGARVVA